ncbi:hypothetical protein, partial [Fibrella forsythiae]
FSAGSRRDRRKNGVLSSSLGEKSEDPLLTWEKTKRRAPGPPGGRAKKQATTGQTRLAKGGSPGFAGQAEAPPGACLAPAWRLHL